MMILLGHFARLAITTYRLVACVFLKKCASMFQVKMEFKDQPSPQEILCKVMEENSTVNEHEAI